MVPPRSATWAALTSECGVQRGPGSQLSLLLLRPWGQGKDPPTHESGQGGQSGRAVVYMILVGGPEGKGVQGRGHPGLRPAQAGCRQPVLCSQPRRTGLSLKPRRSHTRGGLGRGWWGDPQ